ncbi:NK-tumor recognition protein-like isoform X2 [Plodia interpunctella]|uniref:NK-tumor recognition protein-like isoform X2 n=1 Tax=Plodia interpunctella TaxID=58824 RepID=UPI002368F1BF|nr:NK-tumor recognition protein-like isoform X2 [Plodia interpunctella]
MSSLFNLKIPAPEKITYHHPWEKVIKDEFAGKIKYAHNSIKNPKYPIKEVKPKKLVVPKESRVRFTVVGNRVTKEFIYCVSIVKGLHKYRPAYFDPPIIRAVTSVEWPTVWNDLKIRYGELAYCLSSQVAVVMNDTFLGGENELKDIIETNYVYHLRLDYFKEGVDLFATYVKSSGLYSDILPYTCDNFLRLCNQTRGGYGGTPVHRIVKDGWIQCGGYGLKNNEDLGCENFIVPHDRRGVLCMANDGRNVDCSTQFFILLQPAPWMAQKYVAFGQLIDGERTLQKIEQVPTYYESPKKNIMIFKSGIFNMDCHDITINKRAKEYIFGHIEDLYTIGELFYEALLEHVWAEIERREQQALAQVAAGMQGETEGEGDILKDSKRFLTNKEDIEKQLKKVKSAASKGVAPELEEAEHEEFHYDYEEEASQYRTPSVGPTASLIVKPEKPFYLPLTDVPYPDEVDSTFDLKKFLRGDYCHETDLQVRRESRRTTMSYPSEMLTGSDDEDESNASIDLDSDEEREIKKYLSQNVDRVSFAGDTVKKISRGFGKLNVFEDSETYDVLHDELLRKVRTAMPDMPTRHSKKVSVSINADEEEKVHHKIKRRQTGFVRPTELERIRMLAKLKELREQESDEDEEGTKADKKTSIKIHGDDDDESQQKKKKAHAGFAAGVSKTKLHDENATTSKTSLEEKVRRSKRRSEFKQDLTKIHVIEDWDDTDEKKVRISPKTETPQMTAAQEKQKYLARRPTGFVRAAPVDLEDSEFDIHRPSVLQRLYEDVAVDDDEEEGPTLKDYRPKTEMLNKKLNLLTIDKVRLTSDESKEKYMRPSLYAKEPSNESHVLNLQHGKKLGRKISSDYVKTIDQIEKRQHNSIRSVEFAKLRPALSVMDYQSKNTKYQEEQRNSSKHQVNDVKPEDEITTIGLRLPGDTPLYSYDTSKENIKDAGNVASRQLNMVRSKLSRLVIPNYTS